ncbi:MAG: formylglycine-generating enzyme family protein [Candidatus Krumholzibacteriota bacterium]|nr:formylglycine-generating enzyme family protein [Candidatus Krumholzibacteriota bacterium]
MKKKRIWTSLLFPLWGLAAAGPGAQAADTVMVLIPAGEYTMGKDSEKGYDFSPAHRVKIDSFLMDRHEVTNSEYLRFCEETGHRLPEFWGTGIFRSGEDYPDLPVVGVSWADAQKYAEWVGKRLPTEAEWEYAARGGLIDKDYPNGDKWTKERARQAGPGWNNLLDPVETYEPNGLGLYDMSGNVWEWVYDRYSAGYYAESGRDNPPGPEAGKFRVIRGGSWHSGPMCKRVYYRGGLPGNWCDFAVGFRCVKALDAPPARQ